MNFGPNHYVPVLKVKPAEKAALQLISPTLRGRMTPLLEIIERNKEDTPSFEAHLDRAFKGLAASLRGYTRCFLDLREIADEGAAAAKSAFRRAQDEGVPFTPVTGISRSADVKQAIGHRFRGLALRLTRAELEAGGLTQRVDAFVEKHKLAPNEIDLVVDLGAVDALVAEGIAALTTAFLAELPDLLRWRTVTVSGSAFPDRMGGVERHSHALVDRSEWIAWRDDLFGRRRGLARLPTFSDCAVQHPKGVENVDFRMVQMAAAVRYTLPEQWLLIRGESIRRTPSTHQFRDLATQLVYGHLREYFSGPQHCEGCASMKKAADGAAGLGSLGVWRRLGSIHHLTRVMNGLDALPWP